MYELTLYLKHKIIYFCNNYDTLNTQLWKYISTISCSLHDYVANNDRTSDRELIMYLHARAWLPWPRLMPPGSNAPRELDKLRPMHPNSAGRP